MHLAAVARNVCLLALASLPLGCDDPMRADSDGAAVERAYTLHPPGVPEEFETPPSILEYGLDLDVIRRLSAAPT